MPSRLSLNQRIDIVLWYAEHRSVKRVQEEFTIKYEDEPPIWETIINLFKKFKETGSVADVKRSGWFC